MVALALLGGSAWAGTLTGTVRDATSGAPLPGAAVYAYDVRLDGSATLTDLDGRFVLSDLPDGLYRVLVRPDDADNNLSRFYPDAADFCDSPLFSPDGTDLTFDLPAGGEVQGTLLDTEGAPLPGITVIARSLPGTATEYAFERLAITEADGTFLLRGLDGPGEWAIELQGDTIPDQYLGEVYDRDDAQRFEAVPGARRSAGSHAALPGITVRGGVFGPDDPAVGASVIVYAGGQVRSVPTDSDGLYAAQGMAPGDVTVWSEPDGLALTYLPDSDRPTEFLSETEEGAVLEDVDLFPPWPASLSLTIVDAATGTPIPGVSATIYNDDQTVAKGAPAPDGVATIRGLHAGDYTLYVFAADEGFTNGWVLDEAGERRVFSVGPEEAAAEAVALAPAARLEGTILGEDGVPVYGASVYVYSADGGASATTDAEGRFVVAGLAAGDWSIQVDSTPYCLSDPDWVTVYWPGVVYSDTQEALTLAEGEVRQLALTLPLDDDHDGMGDGWEAEYGLDLARDDSAEDPDGDGYPNIWEYWLGTDPTEAEPGTRGCGCQRGDTAAGAWVLAPLLGLGWTRRRRRTSR